MKSYELKTNIPLQVLSVVGDFVGRPIYLFAIIMTSKSNKLYKKIFAFIAREFTAFRPRNMMSDFEWAERNALKTVFKKTRVLGCR